MPILICYWLLIVFVIGAMVGSFLNVAIARLPLEKSLLWPGSRCGACLQPIRWFDNIPLVSYWVLRGKCRTCGAPFSIRYFLVELLTALCVVGLFYLEIFENVHELDILKTYRHQVMGGRPPWQSLIVFGFHAILLSFLLTPPACLPYPSTLPSDASLPLPSLPRSGMIGHDRA